VTELRLAERRVPAAPAHLSASRKRLWKAILGDFELDVHELELLRLACEALERCEEARRAIARDGAYVQGRFGPKAHPAISVERDARIGAARLFREIGLDGEPQLDPLSLRARRRQGGVL
jgi:phage terminase small subunit